MRDFPTYLLPQILQQSSKRYGDFPEKNPRVSKLAIYEHLFVMVWLPPATKAPRSRPSPRRGSEKNGKKQAETGGSG